MASIVYWRAVEAWVMGGSDVRPWLAYHEKRSVERPHIGMRPLCDHFFPKLLEVNRVPAPLLWAFSGDLFPAPMVWTWVGGRGQVLLTLSGFCCLPLEPSLDSFPQPHKRFFFFPEGRKLPPFQFHAFPHSGVYGKIFCTLNLLSLWFLIIKGTLLGLRKLFLCSSKPVSFRWKPYLL